MEYITRMEEILLLSVWKLQKKAYGLSIRKHASFLLDKNLSVGAVYIPLERLVKKGYLSAWESEPTQMRGGRRKRFYQMTAKGVSALNAIRQLNEEAWRGLPNLVFEN